MRTLIVLSLVLILASCQEVEMHPNIVYILADDMGYGDIGYLNPDAGTSTPHLNKLAEEGMAFTDAHSPSAVCTPTRYGILTGRYAFRSRLKSGVLTGYDPPLIENSQLTVAELLRDAGYVTGCIGKWHLGLSWQPRNDALPLLGSGNGWDTRDTENVDYGAEVVGGPQDHGFDYSFINAASLDIAPYVYIENGFVTEQIVEHIEGKNEPRGVFWRHGDRAGDFDLNTTLETYGTKAVEFIQDAPSDRPFFLYLPLTAPHTPWLPGDKFAGTSQAGIYGDFVNQVDDLVGKVMQALDQKNATENTLVIFTSDNGAHWTPEDKKSFDHRANHRFRGMKSDAWEGGHRIPFLARWPGKVKEGSHNPDPMALTDLLATAAEITGQQLPEGQAEDSYSILGSLTKASPSTRPYIIHHSINGTFAIRKGKWKLIDARGSGGWSYPGDSTDLPQQLYDMESDPGETRNLLNEYADVVAQLNSLLKPLMDSSK